MRGRTGTIGQPERQIAIGGGAAKHGLDGRRVGGNVRQHDDDVARRQPVPGFDFARGHALVVGREAIEQLVLQHLDFAQRAVAGMDLEGGVVVGDALHGVATVKTHDIGLNAMQEAVVVGHVIGHQIAQFRLDHARELVGIEHAHGIPCHPAQGRQQRVAGFNECLAGQQGVVVFGLHAGQLQRQAPGGDIAPIRFAGVGQQEIHVDMFGQRVQQAQMIRRECHQPEAVERVRAVVDHALLKSAVGAQPLDEIGQNACPVPAAEPIVAGQPAPDLGLPAAGIGGRRVARFPTGEHVGAIDQVLVEYIGQLSGQLIAAYLVHRIAQIIGHRRNVGGHARQRHIEMPGQAIGFEMIARVGVVDHRMQQGPDELAGQAAIDIRCDAFAVGQLYAQPAADTGVGCKHCVA